MSYDLSTDSGEYEILENSVRKVKDINGFSCEIGTRSGGSSYKIMEILRESGQNKVHISIDPFGNIDYKHWETETCKLDYTNEMKRKMLMNIYKYCYDNKMEFLFFPLEDTEFFERYSDGVPIYNQNKYIMNEYALVFLDGPHTSDIIKNEISFFKDKMPKGSCIVFDDIIQYDHMEKIDPYLQECGFTIFEKGEVKISYIKS